MKVFNETPFSHRAVQRECGLEVMQGGLGFLKGVVAAVRAPGLIISSVTQKRMC